MHWYVYPGYFFGGVFLANAVPHFVNGISGRPFQSPFAKPPGKGLSSSTVNVLWGIFNLALAYLLILRLGSFSIHNLVHVTVVGAGILFISVSMSRHFGQFHGGLLNR